MRQRRQALPPVHRPTAAHARIRCGCGNGQLLPLPRISYVSRSLKLGECHMRAFIRPALAALAAGALFVSFGTSAVADANKKVKIINETRHVMVQFHASRVGTKDWEEDILGQDTVPVGGSVTVNFGTDDYCLYD